LLRRPHFAHDPADVGGKLERIDLVSFDAARDPRSFALERQLLHYWCAAALAPFGVILAHSAFWCSEDHRAIPFFVISSEDLFCHLQRNDCPGPAASPKRFRCLAARRWVTLKDAGNYITKLPKAEPEAPEWHAAMKALDTRATSGGPTMLARVGVMQALTVTSSACSTRRENPIIRESGSSRETNNNRP
jgi:hypothetical protein